MNTVKKKLELVVLLQILKTLVRTDGNVTMSLGSLVHNGMQPTLQRLALGCNYYPIFNLYRKVINCTY